MMKKVFFSFCARALVMYTFSSCGGGDEAAPTDNPPADESGQVEEEEQPVEEETAKMVDMDMSSYGYPFTMSLPEGATIEEGYFGHEIKSGEGFQVSMSADATPVADMKAEAEANDINVIKAFVVDEETGYVTENEVMGQSEYHWYYVLTTDTMTYQFENVKGRSYSKEEAMTMYNSAKSASVQ